MFVLYFTPQVKSLCQKKGMLGVPVLVTCMGPLCDAYKLILFKFLGASCVLCRTIHREIKATNLSKLASAQNMATTHHISIPVFFDT